LCWGEWWLKFTFPNKELKIIVGDTKPRTQKKKKGPDRSCKRIGR